MNIKSLIIVTLIVTFVFFFSNDKSTTRLGLKIIGCYACILYVCIALFCVFSKEVSRESYALKSYDSTRETVEYIVDDNVTAKGYYIKKLKYSDPHVEVVRKQWLFLYSENCYLYLNK